MSTLPRLAIDAQAEAARLAGGELDGPWQAPAELVRRALRAGAAHVAVACGPRGYTVDDDGAPLDSGTVDALAGALEGDAGRLAALADGPHAELAFVTTSRLLAVESHDGRQAVRVLRDGAGRSHVETLPSRRRRVIVRVDGARYDAAHAREWLLSVARFADGRVSLDGETVPPYEPAALGGAALVAPLAGRLWLPLVGDEGALWLVQDGIVSAFLHVPGSLPFEAVVDVPAPRRTAAALRDWITPHVGALTDQAARLALDLAQRPAGDASARRRLRRILLDAARTRRWRGEALRAPVFTGLDETGPSALGLRELPALADEDRRIATCTSAAAAQSLFLGPRPAVVLEPDERARLAQELGLRFAEVPRARDLSPRTVAEKVRHAWSRVRRV